MSRFFIVLAIAALVFSTLACGFPFYFKSPFKEIKTGPTETYNFDVPLPDQSDQLTHLEITFAAGDLLISPKAEKKLVQGTATYNISVLKPEVEIAEDTVKIKTGEWEIQGIPNFEHNFRNQWDLKLGNTPLDLKIQAGAYKGTMDLGGLALQALDITDGAAEVSLKFSSPNPAEMDTFRYKTGASTVKLTDLANANFNSMIFKGGAGSYTFDYSGELKRDATVIIDAGMSSLVIIVPEGTNTRLFYDGGLSDVDTTGAWQKSGNDFTLQGSGPQLTINVNLGAGSLELRNEP